MDHSHENHDHAHGSGCGHTAIRHGDHTDFLHDGHLHHAEADGSVSEHVVEVGPAKPAACTPQHDGAGHAMGHKHGPDCGHEPVPHGDHTDYLVNGHLHHPHGDDCDDHGPVKKA